ncbi:hypothetical protein [Clostridium estertheticum]|uniref:hypothetical protein n=1 Tax=Clostridium estertheticum TaxID=238834 RepID=UPI001C0D7E6C|nr:hypothetical protein [Clostridium estertheticum]MBU3186661.1 hypothetical protein [Clostridium estertheticum]
MLNIIDSERDYKYTFILCRPNKKPVTVLSEAFNTVYKCEFKSIDELDFDIPYYVTDSSFNKVKNGNWDLILADYLILMEIKDNNIVLHNQYFTINTPKLTGIEKETLHVHGYSLEYLITKKKLRDFQGTRQLYKSPNDTVEIGEGILNLLLSVTNWTIGYIDPESINEEIASQSHRKYRTFNVTEKTWIDFIRTEIELSYACVLDFDTDKEEINIYSIDNYGENKGLYLSEDNYLKTINWSVEADNVVTQLSVYGLDNLGISKVNVTGENYVEDYTPYRSLAYMEQDLLDAFTKYDALLKANDGVYAGYLTQLADYNSLKTQYNSQLVDLNAELQVLLDTRDGNLKLGTSLTSINGLMATKNLEITAKLNQITGITISITSVNLAISTLKTLLLKENNFTSSQLKELIGFQRQETWSNDNYFDVDSLYVAGKKALTTMNEPVIVVEINSVSFVDCIDCQEDWDKLKKGDIVNVEYKKWNKYIQCRLIGYTHSIDKCTLALTLSNKNYKLDAENYIGQISSSASTSATTIAVKKSIWNYAGEAYDQVTAMASSELDTALRQIICSRNQGITIDERGMNFTDTTNKNEQMKLINNLLVMTIDNWETASTAISPKGLVADTLIGHLIAGNKVIVSDEKGTVTIDGNGFSLSETRTDGQATIDINTTDGISITNANKKVFYLDLNGNIVANDGTFNNITAINGTFEGEQKTVVNGITLIQNYKNANGGVTLISDIHGNLNAKLGSENGTALNVGGTLILYNDSLYMPRVELGISTAYGAGGMNLKDSTGKVRVLASANTNFGAVLAVLDSSEYAVSYLAETIGKINNQTIATQDWVEAQGYATKDYVQSYVSSHQYYPPTTTI